MNSTTSRWVGILFICPALVFVLVFVVYPLGDLAYTSMTNASLLGGSEFVGFDNYQNAFNDQAFWRATWFTVQYTLYLTPVLMILGFLLALLALDPGRLRQFTRAVVFLPVVIGLGSSSFMWFWLFDQQVGLFNQLLVDLAIIPKPLVWFRKPDVGQLAVAISVTWKVVGFGMIIMAAGMQAIGTEILEAALIDGASYWQRVRRIILPLTARTILLVTLISAIGSMLAFDQFFIMTGGAPRGQTFTSVYWIYQNSFVYFKLGYGAALSIILMAIVMAGVAVQIGLTRKGAQT